jgi:RNA polymerase sigma factor (TIGR02999 family)
MARRLRHSMSDTALRHEITDVLVAARHSGENIMERLMPLVYGELRRIARRQLRAEATGHTLSTDGLVHETYLKLVDQSRAEWKDRSHFFAVAARAMRRILVDYSRRHTAARRGGRDRAVVSLSVLESGDAVHGVTAQAVSQRAEYLLALDEAIERLAELNPRLARIVEYRFFAGLSEDETAEALGVSVRTVARDWRLARGWLYEELREDIS